jgi:adenylate cyclase class IV
MFEVELRFAISEAEQAQRVLKDAQKIGANAQTDEYFDFEGLPLYRRNAFVRVRDHCKLNLKYFAHKDSNVGEEMAFEFGNGALEPLNGIAAFLKLAQFKGNANEENVKRWLGANGLKPLIVIDKKRTQFKDAEYVYALDEVNGLGTFLEIEKETESEKEAEAIRAKLRKHAEQFDLKIIDNTGYVQMYVEKFYPQLL